MKPRKDLIKKATKMTAMLSAIILFASLSFSQDYEKVFYKQADTSCNYMYVFSPESLDKNVTYPAMIFFHGGAGGPKTGLGQFSSHAEYFSKRGMVCFVTRRRSNIFHAFEDAKSIVRFIRKSAKKYHVDTSKVISAGGSYGGMLASFTALGIGFDDKNDDLSISCRPNALVLYNPGVDIGPAGIGYDRVGEKYKDCSPLHNIRKGAPPTIFFLGTEDHLIPVATAEYYKTVMDKVGSRCELKLYNGQPHGFFNEANEGYYKVTLSETDKFLTSLGYIEDSE